MKKGNYRLLIQLLEMVEYIDNKERITKVKILRIKRIIITTESSGFEGPLEIFRRIIIFLMQRRIHIYSVVYIEAARIAFNPLMHKELRY